MLRDLLNDLLNQTRMPDEIIVIDNASNDGTEMIVRDSFPEIRYIRLEENAGSAGGYCEGIMRAADESDFIYTLDDDVRLNSDSVEQIFNGMTTLDHSKGYRAGAVRSVGEGHRDTAPSKLDIFPWRGTLLKTDVVRKVGPPRKEFFLYGEDLEYALRFAKYGYSCYWIPASICVERRKRGMESNKIRGIYTAPFRLYYAFRNEISIYLEYRRRAQLLHTLAFAIKVVLFISFSKGSSGLKGCRAVIDGIEDGFRGKLGKNLRYLPA
jgi:rhamnopyranosyl-N-acetylglucosaminyl-diphospho-decaprenol beta-1,3/1,4-galactofuranosyltransferase